MKKGVLNPLDFFNRPMIVENELFFKLKIIISILVLFINEDWNEGILQLYQ